MSNRRFIIFFLTGIVLISAILSLLSYRSRIVASEVTRNTLCTFAPESVSEISLNRKGTNVVRLARNDFGAWNIVAPFSASADASVVARLADTLTMMPFVDLRTEDELADLGEDLADFGLCGNSDIEVSLTANGKSSRISFGAISASGKDVYAKAGELKNVFIFPVKALEVIPQTADEFRSRKLIDCSQDMITGLDLRLPESPFIRLQREKNLWRMSSPVNASCDAPVVDALVSELANATVSSFVHPSVVRTSSPSDSAVLPQSVLMSYGLTSETALSVTVKYGSGIVEQVLFGSSAGTNLVYALTGNGKTIVTIDSNVSEIFRKGDAAFRDTRVFPIDVNDSIKSVSLSSDDFVYVLSCDTNGIWRIEAPVAAQANQGVVASYVEKILRMRRNDVSDAESDHGAVRISVVTSATGYPDVKVLPAFFKDCEPIANLRSKLLIEIDPAGVRGLSVKSFGEKSVSVVYDDIQGTWNMAPGSAPLTVHVPEIKKMIACLTHIEAEEVESVAATPEDMMRCGLTNPSAVIAVDFATAGSVRRNLIIGATAPNGGRYATTGGADAIFILSRATADNLLLPIAE